MPARGGSLRCHLSIWCGCVLGIVTTLFSVVAVGRWSGTSEVCAAAFCTLYAELTSSVRYINKTEGFSLMAPTSYDKSTWRISFVVRWNAVIVCLCIDIRKYMCVFVSVCVYLSVCVCVCVCICFCVFVCVGVW